MNLRTALSAAALSLAAISAQASLLPSGVMNDVGTATVSGWGFSQCYSETYGSSGRSIANILAGCQGDYLMMAARPVGSSTFDVLAAANRSDVIFDTGFGNVTHTANNVEWYFSDNWSWGFAGLGDVVNRVTCDSSATTERDRLCWHTSRGESRLGYRSGNNFLLDNDWEKVLLVANRSNVPEPTSLALLAGALLALSAARRRRA